MHSVNPRASSLKSEQDLLELLRNSAQSSVINECSFGGANAVIHAVALFGGVEMLKFLVEDCRAEVDHRNEDGILHSLLPASTAIHNRHYIYFAKTPVLKCLIGQVLT